MSDWFQSPIWLLTLLGVVALIVGYVILQRRRRAYVARFSNASLLASIAPKRPGWRRHLTFAFLTVALASLCLGAAKPTGEVRVPSDRATVILAIDVSLSMQATDVLPDRIDAAKAAAKEFVNLLPARINLGLVSFSGQVSVKVAPTVDRDAVKVAIDNLKLGDSTAIGEAIYSSLDAITSFAAQTTSTSDAPPPARIVLMSDGFNNVGREPTVAAKAAKVAGVPVSTIAFGTENGTVNVDGQSVQVPADRTTLKAVADISGGTFHTATSEAELKQVYADIGSQIGYSTERRDVSWRFLVLGLGFGFAAAAASLLWAGRLL
jgi:Ca-activated chloride channel family protein